jgi:hypothetical protein
MNAALLMGFLRWAGKPQNGIWNRTERKVNSNVVEEKKVTA